jgi:hypothetical protein
VSTGEPFDFLIGHVTDPPPTASQWTCSCGEVGHGFATWMVHRQASDDPVCKYGRHPDHVHIDLRVADLDDVLRGDV